MDPVHEGVLIGMTVLNIGVMIVGICFWSSGAHLHRKAARARASLMTYALQLHPPVMVSEKDGVLTRAVPLQPTPGCDCGLTGRPFGYHGKTCAWVRAYIAANPPTADHG